MTDEELFDALDGLWAYDTGSTDSGIHDEGLRERVKAELAKDLAGLSRLTKFTRRYLEAPYNVADVASFIRWLAHDMEIDL